MSTKQDKFNNKATYRTKQLLESGQFRQLSILREQIVDQTTRTRHIKAFQEVIDALKAEIELSKLYSLPKTAERG